jgi:hypothetical protein
LHFAYFHEEAHTWVTIRVLYRRFGYDEAPRFLKTKLQDAAVSLRGKK